MARVEQLVRDDHDRPVWEPIGEVDEDRDPYVALAAWADDQDELVSAAYVAVCSDGRRTRPIHLSAAATPDIARTGGRAA